MLAKSPITSGVGLGLIFFAMALAIGFIIPHALTPFSIGNCRPDEVFPQLQSCEVTRPVLQYVETFLTTIGFFLFPLAMGIFVGLMWTRDQFLSVRRSLGIAALAAATLLAGLMTFEILWYEPWSSIPYNRFELNRIFTTWFALIIPFFSFLGLVIAMAVSPKLWQLVKPLGFLTRLKVSK